MRLMLWVMGCGSSGVPVAESPAPEGPSVVDTSVLLDSGTLDTDSGPAPTIGGNVLVILADDFGIEMMSLYGVYEHQAPMPRLDELAASGVVFETVYAAQACSPARAAMLTGRHPSRHGIGKAIDVTGTDGGLPDEELTFAEVLAEHGYARTLIGKWHLDQLSVDDYELRPLEQGFEHYQGVMANVDDYYSWRMNDNGVFIPDERYLLTAEVDDALAQLNTLVEPWAMVVSLHSVHTPMHVPPDDLFTVEVPDPPDQPTGFNPMIEAMDTEVGRLLDAVSPDTTVVFIADNGSSIYAVDEPFTAERAKGTLHEGGVRVPMILRAPWIAAPGSRSDALVHIVDLMPTIIEIATGDPDVAQVVIDGISLVPHLRDGLSHPREYLFAETLIPNFSSEPKMSAIRDHRHKLMRSADETLFFELSSASPDEGPNLLEGTLSVDQQAALDRLETELDRIRAELDH